MGTAKKAMTAGFAKKVPPGPPVTSNYRVDPGHPCYGCRMYTNPCVYPCFRRAGKTLAPVAPLKSKSTSGGK